MGYCNHCRMKIRDNTMVCPLCQTVLESEKGRQGNVDVEEEGEGAYPQNLDSRVKWSTLLRFFLLFSILCEGILVLINIITFRGHWWSIICGGAVIFSYVSLKHWTRNYSGHVVNIFIELLSACALSILIDYVLDYRGWSLNYAVPCAIISSELAVVVLMVIFFNTWYRYLSMLLFDLILSIIMVCLIPAGIVDKPVMTFVAAGISLLIFSLTVIIGGGKAENELKRRFHI